MGVALLLAAMNLTDRTRQARDQARRLLAGAQSIVGARLSPAPMAGASGGFKGGVEEEDSQILKFGQGASTMLLKRAQPPIHQLIFRMLFRHRFQDREGADELGGRESPRAEALTISGPRKAAFERFSQGLPVRQQSEVL